MVIKVESLGEKKIQCESCGGDGYVEVEMLIGTDLISFDTKFTTSSLVVCPQCDGNGFYEQECFMKV